MAAGIRDRGLVRLGASGFAALAFLSGMCALGYEVLYVRHLTTLLGDMLYVHAALLSSFLLGVAIGARLAYRAHRWLGILEIATGVCAIAIPLATRGLRGTSLLAAITASPAATVATTAALMAGPSLLIGFALPLFSAYVKTRLSERRAFEAVYAVYNLGAVLGILGVEMWLVRTVGIRASLAALGSVNVAIGLILLGSGSLALQRPEVPPLRFTRATLWALAVASTASALFQMAFLQRLFLLYGPHRENFAIGLAVVLLGVALGAWLAARFPIRFATALVLVPVTLAATMLAHPTLVELYEAAGPWAHGSPLRTGLVRLGFGSAHGLLPMTLFGALLPALMRSERAVAEEAGQLLWISGAANAVGYLAYVGVVQPLLPTAGVAVTISVLVMIAALIHDRTGIRRLDAGIAAAAGVLMLAGVLRWSERDLYAVPGRQFLDSSAPFDVFRFGGESVAPFGGGTENEWVSYNGHPSIWIRTGGQINYAEVVSGVIPALAAPRRDRALVLGLGTGITAGATARLFRHVDVVEINRAFLDLLPRIPDANLGIQDNPAAVIHVTDGRAFLDQVAEPYDAIVNSIPAPTYFSASKIYTREFYERVVGALAPDGIFATWLSVTDMTPAGMDLVLSELAEAFRHCDLRLMRQDYYMATCSALPVSSRPFSALSAAPQVGPLLRGGLPGLDLDWFFEDARLTPDAFARVRPQARQANTDDFPVLEFLLSGGERSDGPDAQSFEVRWPSLGIHLTGDGDTADPARFAHRAEVFRRLAPLTYRHVFAERVRADSAVSAAMRGLQRR